MRIKNIIFTFVCLLVVGCVSTKVNKTIQTKAVHFNNESPPISLYIESVTPSTEFTNYNQIILWVTNTVQGQQYLMEYTPILPTFLPYISFTGTNGPLKIVRYTGKQIAIRFYRVNAGVQSDSIQFRSDVDSVALPSEILSIPKSLDTSVVISQTNKYPMPPLPPIPKHLNKPKTQ